jgi:hypothetical protein
MMAEEDYDPEETARRRDAVLKIMVNTAPQPRVSAPSPKAGKRKKAASDRAVPPKGGRGKPGPAS